MVDDEQRFADVYRRTHAAVLAYSTRRAPMDTAREATDETVLIAWRRFDVVPSDPLPWLIVTARNVLVREVPQEGLRMVAPGNASFSSRWAATSLDLWKLR